MSTIECICPAGQFHFDCEAHETLNCEHERKQVVDRRSWDGSVIEAPGPVLVEICRDCLDYEQPCEGEECNKCEGVGRLYTTPSFPSTDRSVVCTDCGGSGYVKTETAL